jgi:hypothetical protein
MSLIGRMLYEIYGQNLQFVLETEILSYLKIRKELENMYIVGIPVVCITAAISAVLPDLHVSTTISNVNTTTILGQWRMFWRSYEDQRNISGR